MASASIRSSRTFLLTLDLRLSFSAFLPHLPFSSMSRLQSLRNIFSLALADSKGTVALTSPPLTRPSKSLTVCSSSSMRLLTARIALLTSASTLRSKVVNLQQVKQQQMLWSDFRQLLWLSSPRSSCSLSSRSLPMPPTCWCSTLLMYSSLLSTLAEFTGTPLKLTSSKPSSFFFAPMLFGPSSSPKASQVRSATALSFIFISFPIFMALASALMLPEVGGKIVSLKIISRIIPRGEETMHAKTAIPMVLTMLASGSMNKHCSRDVIHIHLSFSEFSRLFSAVQEAASVYEAHGMG
mmetsp:Transcript_19941/g.41474  ORF Transcript_19941/g.41474 Transcript_19941/m.41474 type:complete len:296 (-) Transcript_19941:3767-4654(-)